MSDHMSHFAEMTTDFSRTEGEQHDATSPTITQHLPPTTVLLTF